MLDAIYMLGTVALFALMLAYVRACASLGRRGEAAAATDQPSRGRTP